MKCSLSYKANNDNDIICLANNENQVELPVCIQKLIGENLNCANKYPDTAYSELKSKISNMYNVKSENILMGAGSDEILMLITMKFVSKGENTIMANPSFFRYKQITELVGGKCKAVESKNFYYDLECIKRNIDDKTKIIFICNPNNPTGTLITTDEIEDFVSNIPENIIVVVDEAYFEYVHPKATKSAIELINKYENVIVLRTFSKFYSLAGLRIGYAISNKKLINAVNVIKSPYNVNSVAQLAASMIIDNKDFIDTVYNDIQREKEFYYDSFNRLGIEYIVSQTSFVFVNFGKECEEYCNYLKENKIEIRRCDIFGYPDYARISMGTSIQNRKVIEVITKMMELRD